MSIPVWLALTVTGLVAAGIIALVVHTWRRGAKARSNLDAQFTRVFAPFVGRVRWARQPGAICREEHFGAAVGAACRALVTWGPWAENDLIETLYNVRIYVRNRDKWTDLWGREVAGVALVGTDPSTTIVEIGNSLDALCHELAEVLYAHLSKGTGAWHEADWAGRASAEKACGEYQRLLVELNGIDQAWRAVYAH